MGSGAAGSRGGLGGRRRRAASCLRDPEQRLSQLRAIRTGVPQASESVAVWSLPRPPALEEKQLQYASARGTESSRMKQAREHCYYQPRRLRLLAAISVRPESDPTDHLRVYGLHSPLIAIAIARCYSAAPTWLHLFVAKWELRVNYRPLICH